MFLRHPVTRLIALTTALATSSLYAATDPAERAGGPPKKKRGEIHGFKFNDRNGNGERDPGEERLEGFRILINSLGSKHVSRSKTTDEDGEYHFERLPLQRYEVCEVPPEATPPWIPTTPECVTVRLTVVVTSYVEVAHETNNLDGPLMIEWVDFTSQEYFRNPTSEIERLRALGPVVKPT